MSRSRQRRPIRNRLGVFAVAAALCGACQPEPAVIPPNSPAVGMIVIVGYAHTPRQLTAWPGGSIVVRNEDAVLHTLTSSAVAGSHVYGGVDGVAFDTGQFLRGERVITIAADAPVGTVVPYFCAVHLGAEVDEGAIEIVAPPSP